ncbi:MAG: type III secretion system chaperone [Dongiaceae bacterium]
MSIELMRSLLRDLGAEIGIPELAPDEDGFCCLEIGGRVRLSLQYDPEGQDLALFAPLCRLAGGEDRAEAQAAMLAGNMLWAGTQGGTLAVEPAEGTAFLQMKEKIQELDRASLVALVERFVQVAEVWQDRLAAYAADAAEAAAPEAGESAPRPADLIRLA